DERLLAAVARRPHPALLPGGRRGGLRRRRLLGGTCGRGHLERRRFCGAGLLCCRPRLALALLRRGRDLVGYRGGRGWPVGLRHRWVEHLERHRRCLVARRRRGRERPLRRRLLRAKRRGPLVLLGPPRLYGAAGELGTRRLLGPGGSEPEIAADRLGELGPRIGLLAELHETLGNAVEHARVAVGAGRPLRRQVAEIDRPREARLPFGEHAPLLHLAGAVGGRVLELLARVEQQMLEVRAHAGGDVLEALPRLTPANGAEAGEVVLRRLHVARPVAA